MIVKFLDDTFRNIRCYSRCCEINECSCSNGDLPVEDEITTHQHHHRQRTPDSQISNHSHHSSAENDDQPHHNNNNENDEGDHVI